MANNRGGTYLSNGEVAWQIPPDQIASLYCMGAYLPPHGWKVVYSWDIRRYLPGVCGEMRRELENEQLNKT